MTFILSSSQLRAARGILNWSRSELAARTGISEQTILRFENNLHSPEPRTRDKIQRILDENGLELTSNEGVKYKSRVVEIYEGPERFDEFYDFIYEHVKKSKGNISIYGHNGRLFLKYLKDPELHWRRMTELRRLRHDFLVRTLQEEGDDYMPNLGFSTYRWQKKEFFPPVSYYIFGKCVALISFEEIRPPFVILIKSALFADAFLKSFNLAWRSAEEPPKLKAKKRASFSG